MFTFLTSFSIFTSYVILYSYGIQISDDKEQFMQLSQFMLVIF